MFSSSIFTALFLLALLAVAKAGVTTVIAARIYGLQSGKPHAGLFQHLAQLMARPFQELRCLGGFHTNADACRPVFQTQIHIQPSQLCRLQDDSDGLRAILQSGFKLPHHRAGPACLQRVQTMHHHSGRRITPP